MVTEQEKYESEVLKQEINKKKIAAYEYMRYLSRMSPAELLQSGYRNKTQAEAVKYHLDRTEREIELMIKNFERKFPA